jgi:2-dehydropantoate 2-reductase
LKVCVYGAGGIGGVIAARLALSGVETAIVARGEHLAAIQASGLTYQTPQGTEVIPIAASDDPAALGPQDVVISAVKAHQIPAVARRMLPLLGRDTAVVYAINGIPWWYFRKSGGPWNDRRLARLDPGDVLWNEVGVDRTIGCVVNLPSAVTAPGVVRYEGGNNRLALGEVNDSPSSRLSALAEALTTAGFTIETHRPIRFEVWNKLALIMVSSPLSVLIGRPARLAQSDSRLRDVARNAWLEVIAIAAAYGIKLDGDVEAKLSAWSGAGSHRPSILQDLDRGRPLEIDPQITVPVELAHDAGVPVPTLDLLARLMRARARAAGLYGR